MVCDDVNGRLRFELRLTWLGGSRILDRVERRLDTLLLDRPSIGLIDTAWLVWRALQWRRM